MLKPSLLALRSVPDLLDYGQRLTIESVFDADRYFFCPPAANHTEIKSLGGRNFNQITRIQTGGTLFRKEIESQKVPVQIVQNSSAGRAIRQQTNRNLLILQIRHLFVSLPSGLDRTKLSVAGWRLNSGGWPAISPEIFSGPARLAVSLDLISSIRLFNRMK